MKTTFVFPLAALLIASLSCGPSSKAANQVSRETPPANNTCSLDNWRLLVTSVQEKVRGDGTKDVIVNVGIENNDHLWGFLDGPYSQNNPKPVTMTTANGKVYEPTVRNIQIDLDNGDFAAYASGFIHTPDLPPGFTASGQSFRGGRTRYSFAFNIPNAEMPATFSIDTLQIHCFGADVEVNGQVVYGGGLLLVPPMTYNLSGGGVQNVHEEPTASDYPELKRGRRVLDDTASELEVTDVTRQGNIITVTFNYTNRSSYPQGPVFQGYIIGNQNIFTCLAERESDCHVDHSGSPETQPGQTIQGLTWTFVVPKDESNLLFVYISGQINKAHSDQVYDLGL
jgi:hypothetical protein